MTPAEAVGRAVDHCEAAEDALLEAQQHSSPTRRSDAEIHAALGEAYARIGSALVVLETSSNFVEEGKIASVAGLPGARA